MNPELLRLIAITDDLHDGVDGLAARAADVVRGGATMVEVRLKHADARVLVEVTRALVARLAVPIIVNDRTDVALAGGAAGVHLGPDDLPIRSARAIVPRGFIIGASVRDDEDLREAAEADFIAIGPVYGTQSKRGSGVPIGLSELERLVRLSELPAVAVGGMNPENVAAAMETGVVGAAALSALFGAEHPDRAALGIRSAIGR